MTTAQRITARRTTTQHIAVQPLALRLTKGAAFGLARGLLVAVLGLGIAGLGSALAAPPLLQGAALRPTFGGVLLEAHLVPKGNGALNGVWADAGRANLMRCSPSCSIVGSIPLGNSVIFSQNSVYRVVLGGQFRPKQRIKLLLRFTKGDPVTVEVPVSAK